MTELTAGQLLDLLRRSFDVIFTLDERGEHKELKLELVNVQGFIARQIEGSHMGCGRDVVIIEAGGL